MEINERGYWEGVDLSKHQFDLMLAQSIIHLVIRENWTNVIDIGCGLGYYTATFNSNGIPCRGYDGNPNTPDTSHNECEVVDFSEPVSLYPMDMVLSLEVGEHIPEKYEKVFIENLIKHANKTIILSWAVMHQGGFGHVNCQNNDHVIKAIEYYDFKYDPIYSEFLRIRSTKSWFKETIMVFHENK